MTTGRAAVNDVTTDDDAQVATPREGAVGIAGVPPAEITERLLVPAITRHVRRAFSDP